MLTILDMVNHYFGLFNVNTKFKGRLYTVLGFGGVWYIFYIAISFLTAHRWLRGFGLLLAFVALMYVIYLNFMYYFTQKDAKLDISPKIEKIMGGPQNPEVQKQARAAVIVPAHGLYEQKQVLPTAMQSNPDEENSLNQLANDMAAMGLITTDYQGMSDDDLRASLSLNGNQPIYANHPGAAIPYFHLTTEGTHLIVYGGVNEMQAVRLGEIIRIGLADTKTALAQFDLFLASVVLQGGPGKTLARSSFFERDYPYTLKVEVAYAPKKQ
ncbi:hypothetical protein EQG49_08510 [Periweissella cryptocerci]|uniref:Uncharacterized protein n=1 Tax=Periweissella cryptocerci TaxID=2506420 RepID=A0A4P6YUS8_9LACO|nr:DUF6681 family protein [Periweissella cryptocerci]QBO36512.1 hypothetical protein EQG49_08510 [Periweissella cryptocerci]